MGTNVEHLLNTCSVVIAVLLMLDAQITKQASLARWFWESFRTVLILSRTDFVPVSNRGHLARHDQPEKRVPHAIHGFAAVLNDEAQTPQFENAGAILRDVQGKNFRQRHPTATRADQ